ncbi:MAG: lipoyl(octanoyl) transferase LipB [Gemmataceae bacterium]
MVRHPEAARGSISSQGLLQVHLLGNLSLDETLRLQRSLVYRLGESSLGGALLLVEHPPFVTVGRHGKASDLPFASPEFLRQGWPIRWVARGGETVLHLPGQLAIYPIVSLNRLQLSLEGYLALLHQVLHDLLDDFSIQAHSRSDLAGVLVQQRQIASVGVAIRQQMTLFGAVLNVDPDLTWCRLIPSAHEATSLARERRGPLRHALVRQQLVEHLRHRFGFDETTMVFARPDQPNHERIALDRGTA